MVRRMETTNGHLRPDICPELMGSHEVVAISGRKSASALFHFRDNFDDWPKPVAILEHGAVYVADEIREFFRNHPPQTRLTDEQVTEIQELTHGKTAKDDAAIAARFNVSAMVIYQIRTGRRGNRPSRAKPRT